MVVLVVYASRHGATEGIASHIAARIADTGVAVDLRHVDAVQTVDAYDAVGFGARVYDQSWPLEADRFVPRSRRRSRCRAALALQRGSIWRYQAPDRTGDPQGARAHHDVLAAVKPLDYRVFQGVIREHQWSF